MKIIVDSISYNVEFNQSSSVQNKTPIVFLHGFTGSTNDWDFLEDLDPNYYPILIDLIGHGKTDSPDEKKYYQTESIVNSIKSILDELNIKRAVFYGYSMGGRAALSFTIQHKGMVQALVLESSTAGIKDDFERKQRIEADKKLAEFILDEGVEKFLDYWKEIPLFNSLKNIDNVKLEKYYSLKIKNSPIGFSNSLKGFSTGIMPSYWDLLNRINCKTLLLNGELDTKFTKINLEMDKLFQDSEHRVIKSAGHNIHFEEPEAVINELNRFLKTI